ncbi:MAG: hypothetical protein ABI761_01775 [Saprospiraceae bacterium]
MRKASLVLFVFLLISFLIPELFAQCPMCRMTVESNLQNQSGVSIGRTINAGILYMLAMPYLLVGTLGYLWYKNKKKAELLESEENAHLN